MSLVYTAPARAPVDVAWALIARPARWHQWAPHIRGATGLGDPEVRPGAVGAVLVGLPALRVPLPALVCDVRPGRSWTWVVGPLRIEHAVAPVGDGGSEVSITLSAPRWIERILAATYGPVVGVLVRRLARVAERQAARSTSNSSIEP